MAGLYAHICGLGDGTFLKPEVALAFDAPLTVS